MKDDRTDPSRHSDSPCGHDNPPDYHFCDTCGATLSARCVRCHNLNRRGARFCGHCGYDLGGPAEDHAGIGSQAPATEPDAQTVIAAPDAEDEDVGEPEDPSEQQRLRWLIEHDKRARAARRRRRAWVYATTTAVTGVIAASLLGAVVLRPRPRPAISAGMITTTAPAPPRAGSDVRTNLHPSQAAAGAEAIQSPVARPVPPPTRNAADAIGRGARGEVAASPAAEPPPPAPAQPRAGGELVFLVPGEPPSYDAHREETFALIHPAAPHYNTLLRIDPFDKTGTRVVGDLAESWAVSSDKRTYILKLRRGVKFHDGSEMTSRDVKASYDKIINPPPGVTSARRGEYLEIEMVLAPEPYVVAFKLKWPAPSFIHSLASPWNWIYKADILARDIRWYETHVMGTGPFTFVEHVKGSHWIGRRNPDYWDHEKPYLDGYRALFVRSDSAQVAAIRAERAHIQFRGFSQAQRDDIVRTLGDKATVQESPWNCGLVVAINHERPPFNDRRVRRALTLALDRYQAAAALPRIAIVREVAGVQVPRSLFASSPAELAKLAGYSRDIKKSRAEANHLLAEAGVGNGFSFVLKNRNIPMPYEHIGTWLVDQWRQVNLNVRQQIEESGMYFNDLRNGNFEVSTDFQCGYVVDPDLDLYKFQSRHRSHSNYGRYEDPVLDDLYVMQSRTVDPRERRRYIAALERRLLDEETHYIYTLQWHRIVPHNARVHGWTITPSHYLNNQLDTVWLSE